MSDDKKSIVGGVRDEKKIDELLSKKLEARNRLRAARAEMKHFDVALIHAGAAHTDLQLACW